MVCYKPRTSCETSSSFRAFQVSYQRPEGMNQAHSETSESPPQDPQEGIDLGPTMSPSSACIHPFPDSLPPELTDVVIDHLHGDASSLRACALTSSSWLSTSRYHLFNDVFLENEVSVLRWTQTFPTPSDVPPYVENLHIDCLSLLDVISDVALDLSTFIRLKGLFIGGSEPTPSQYRRLSGNCIQSIALFPSTLQTLSLSFPVIPASAVFLAIRHFPLLDNLYLKCFAVLPSDDTEDTGTGASPSFRGTLTLASHLNYKPLITNLLAFPGGIHFSRLNLAILRDDELPSLRKLVDACSRTITSLHLNIDLAIPESSYLLDLSKVHSLSELHVTLHAMRFPAIPFARMLSSITDAKSRLDKLTLSLFTWRFWIFRDPDAEQWDAVDIALVELSRAVKEGFKVDLVVQVVVNLLEYGPHDVRDILPRLGEKGRVRLMRDGDSTLELSL